MKKLLAFLIVGLFVSLAKATVIPPADARGQSLYTTDFVGAIPCGIDASTGTSFVICNGTAATNALSLGPAIVYGIITSSVSQSDYIVLKDTTGAGSGGQQAAQTGTGSLQSVASTIAVIGNQWQVGVPTASAIWPYPVVNLIKFPVPLQFQYGILANVSSSPVSNNGVSRWTILWRPLYTGRTQTPAGTTNGPAGQ